jgi:photosystem II stability/assembly factor-like uncharacterized protein
MRIRSFALVLWGLLITGLAIATGPVQAQKPSAEAVSALSDVLKWRTVGPNRGGRSIAVAGHADRPHTYYFGATGGELWKTTDGGTTWKPVTDGQLGSSSVGAVEVAPSDSSVVYIGMGEAAEAMPERWRWVAPLATSPHDDSTVYAGSQHLWTTTDAGRHWTKISPDLTYADPETLGPTGGPLIKDQDGPEVYATLFTIAPSPHEAGTVWTGSDDGRIHLIRDDGETWTEVTPPDLEKYTTVSHIHPSTHSPGTAYVSGFRYKLDDRAPYAWKTTDYGETWTCIDAGLPDGHFVRVLREDPMREGLLYAGTEHGVQVSLDGGESWASLSLGMRRHADLRPRRGGARPGGGHPRPRLPDPRRPRAPPAVVAGRRAEGRASVRAGRRGAPARAHRSRLSPPHPRQQRAAPHP